MPSLSVQGNSRGATTPRGRSGPRSCTAIVGRYRNRAHLLAGYLVLSGCPNDPCLSAGCQDEFRLEIAPPDKTQSVTGTFAFSIVVEGTTFQATCTVEGPSEMGCTRSTPEVADASKQPQVSTVKSVEGFERFQVWVSGTPTSVSVVLQREGKTLLDKSVAPAYDQVRASPECPVACESFQEKVQWKEPG